MDRKLGKMRRRTLFAPLLIPVVGVILAVVLLVWVVQSRTTLSVMIVAWSDTQPPAVQSRQIVDLLSTTGVTSVYSLNISPLRDQAADIASRLKVPFQAVSGANDIELLDDEVAARDSGIILVILTPDHARQLAAKLAGRKPAAGGNFYVVTRPRYGRDSVVSLNLTAK